MFSPALFRQRSDEQGRGNPVESFIDIVIGGVIPMLIHAGVVVAFLVIGVLVYIRLTPYDDLALVREGNMASGISLFSIIVGLAIPLAFCLASTTTIIEVLVWGSFTVALQLLAFKVCDWILNDLPERIERGEMSAALVLLSVKLATAFINSAMG